MEKKSHRCSSPTAATCSRQDRPHLEKDIVFCFKRNNHSDQFVFIKIKISGLQVYLMSSWQMCCRQCEASGDVIEDQTLESAHSNLISLV